MSLWSHLVQASKYQIYISRSTDPYLNLSIEHFLLQKSPPHSTVLFLYVNRPCVVIGRNQNPWLEANLRLLRQSDAAIGFAKGVEEQGHPVGNIQLVRRRSGGGTVFHDCGNVNYSVICPTADFTRDKHAEMVTKAIRRFNARARVNERHDIVLDQGPKLAAQNWPDPSDMHRTLFQPSSKERSPLKVSGSAYKLTRQRSLHHGTCLLTSTNLLRISQYLSSPARPFIKARGVESVRSSVANIHAESKVPHWDHTVQFQREVVKTFAEFYGIEQRAWTGIFGQTGLLHGNDKGDWAAGWVDHKMGGIDRIRDGLEELKSPMWLYGQTPQFTLSSFPVEEDDRDRPPLPKDFPSSGRVYLKVKSGQIISSKISISPGQDSAIAEAEMFDSILKDKDIQDIDNFCDILNHNNHDTPSKISNISRWLNTMFGKPG